MKVNEEEEEEPSPLSFDWIPPEVVLKVLSQLKGKTLMASVPQVCKRWRTLCQDIRKVHLDLVVGGATFLLKCSPGGGRRPSCPMVVMLATSAAAAAATAAAAAAAALEVKGFKLACARCSHTRRP